MSVAYLVIILFIVPFLLALYLWRDREPKRGIYYMCLGVSALALVILVTAGDTLAVIMPLGLFLASTSFFAGVYLSGLVRAWRERSKGE